MNQISVETNVVEFETKRGVTYNLSLNSNPTLLNLK